MNLPRHDQLLYLISARGRIGQGVVRKICLHYAQEISLLANRDKDLLVKLRFRLFSPLERLGHIESHSAAGGWAVVPPTLLQDSERPARARLYGAREPAWLETLATFPGVKFRSCEQRFGPATWELRETQAGAFDHLADRLVLARARESGLTILRGLPTFESAVERLQEVVPPEVPMEKFEATRTRDKIRPRWVSATFGQKGLYRMREKPYALWYLSYGAKILAVPPGDLRLVARWWQTKQDLDFSIHFGDGRLSIPALGIPLPVLVDRALRTATGRCPNWNQGRWEFEVELSRAQEVARILGLQLEAK